VGATRLVRRRPARPSAMRSANVQRVLEEAAIER
jgi:hypothetical protein